MNRRILFLCLISATRQPILGARPTAALLLFAVCQRSLPFMPPPENFPKASAKVRQFRELAKYFSNFFQQSMHFFCSPAAECAETGGTGSTTGRNNVQKILKKSGIKS